MSSTPETLLWFCAVFTLVIANNSSVITQSSSKSNLNCNRLKSGSQQNNISIYNYSASGDHLNICVNNGSTCCSQHTEHYLHKLSAKNLDSIFTVKTDLIKKIFNEGRTKFDGFFKDLINDSEKKLHQEFIRIYKAAYVNNSHITHAFYTNLQKYYSDSKPSPKEIIRIFFKEVLKKIFVLLNPGVSVNLDCVGGMFDTHSQLFGDVPRRLAIQIERSFTAAKTFVYGFVHGKLVVDKIIERRLSKQCLKSVTKMTQCSKCAGHTNAKPCAGYCQSIFSDCYAPLLALDKIWDDYLKQMQTIALRLEILYDIEVVANSLPFEISNGIMNFHKANPTMSPKIKKTCSKRNKRSEQSLTSDTSDFFLESNDRIKRSPRRNDKKPNTSALSSMTKQYRAHFEKLKKFWKKLPEALCDETVVANNITDNQCWNGRNLVNNTSLVQATENGYPVNNGHNDVEVEFLYNKLRSAIKKLKAAISGNNVPPDDPSILNEEFSGSGSGGGSGSGSGSGEKGTKNTIDNNDTDDVDDPNSQITSTTTECANCIPEESKGNTGVLFSLSLVLLTATCTLQLIL